MHDCIVLDRVWPPAPGASHFGGQPNLPPELEWPRIQFPDGTTAALDFLAQIDLESLPDVYERGLLPASGTLYFFALSQSHVPLAEFGPQAFRVLYHPGSAAAIPARAAPEDAGWNLDERDHTRTPAALWRDPDAPHHVLHPYCPVRARRVALVAGKIVVEEAAPSTFVYPAAELPLRVADALLHLYYARNHWFENIVPFDAFVAHLKAQAVSGIAYQKRQSEKSGKPPRPPAPYQTTIVSPGGVEAFTGLYHQWRDRAARCCAALAAHGPSTVLTAAQRAEVLALFAEASGLSKRVSLYGIMGCNPVGAVRLSLTQLLLDDPGLAAQSPQEVTAANPAGGDRPHRMLGPPRRVQGGTMGADDTFVLLQLESDPLGPRFEWWDGGNLTFWMTVKDAAARRFDRAQAEIEGH